MLKSLPTYYSPQTSIHIYINSLLLKKERKDRKKERKKEG